MSIATIQMEAWIVKQLAAPDLLCGVTTPAQRKERIRARILERKIENAIAGGLSRGRPESWAQLFARIYGEPLIPPGETEQLPLTARGRA